MFSSGAVEGLVCGRDFYSGTGAPSGEWRELTPQVLSVLLDHFSSGAPLFKPGSAGGINIAPAETITENPEDADIVSQIKELIETRVRPAVAQDRKSTRLNSSP